MIRPITILHADTTREHMTCDIHPDGVHHGATVVAFEAVDGDAAGFRCVVRGGGGMNPFSIEPPAWIDDAICPQVDPEIFFAEKGSSRAAKAICATCPVAAECLQDALDRGEMWGIFGGLTFAERRALQRAAA